MTDSFDKRTLYVTQEQINEKVRLFRSEHWPRDTIPVDIELIIELQGLVLEPISGMKRDVDITACLCPDLQTIVVDLETMCDPRQAFYFRFSIAHEVGHLVLHRVFFQWQKACGIRSVREWVRLVRKCNTELFPYRFERDADEFAGQLLVPRNHLEKALKGAWTPQQREEVKGFPAESVREFLASRIYRHFEVNPKVIAIRLEREGLY